MLVTLEQILPHFSDSHLVADLFTNPTSLSDVLSKSDGSWGKLTALQRLRIATLVQNRQFAFVTELTAAKYICKSLRLLCPNINAFQCDFRMKRVITCMEEFGESTDSVSHLRTTLADYMFERAGGESNTNFIEGLLLTHIEAIKVSGRTETYTTEELKTLLEYLTQLVKKEEEIQLKSQR